MHIHMHNIFRLKSELGEIYLNQVIQTFALALIGVFIPIYLLKLGFSLPVVLGFLAVYFLALGGLSPVAARTASKIGLKHVILYRLPALIIYYILLMVAVTLSPSTLLAGLAILLIAFIGGASDSFYWVSLNSEFVKNSKKLHAGEEVGNLLAFPKLAAVAAPLLGAIVLEIAGFSALFILAILLLLTSVAPLFITDDMKTIFSFRLKETWFRPRIKIEKKFMKDFLLRGFIFAAETVLWPLWIFLNFNNMIDVGLAATLSGVGMAVFTLGIGKASDRMNKIKLMKLSGISYAAVWFLRVFATNIMEMLILSFLGGVLMAAVALTMFASFCDFARERNVLADVVFREVWLNAARIILLLLLILMAGSFEFAFALAGIISLAFLFV